MNTAQNKFKQKYGFDAVETLNSAANKYIDLIKVIGGLEGLLNHYFEQNDIKFKIEKSNEREFGQDLIEAYIEAGEKFPQGLRYTFEDNYEIKVTPQNPAIPKSKGILEDFQDVASDDELRPAMNGVYVDDNVLVATDAHALVVYKNSDFKKDYNGKIIDLPTYIKTKGKNVRTIDARFPDYKQVIPDNENTPNVIQNIPTYALYNFCKSCLNVKKYTDKNTIFNAKFNYNGLLYGFNPTIMNEAIEFALKKGFDTCTMRFSEPNRAFIFEFGGKNLGLVMPVRIDEEDHRGSTTVTIDEIIKDFSGDEAQKKSKPATQKATKQPAASAIPSAPIPAAIPKDVPYKKYTGSMENVEYVSRRDIAAITLKSGEVLSNADIIDGIYRLKKGKGKKFAKGGIIQSEKELRGMHEKIKKELEKIGIVSGDIQQLPNKYGDNISAFTIKYNIEDRWNYTIKDIHVDYTSNVIFIANQGYFPFTSKEEIISIIKNNFEPKFAKGGRMDTRSELKRGISVEQEHSDTFNKLYRRKISPSKAARSVAKEHLKEDPHYYSKLAKVEGKYAKGGMVVTQIKDIPDLMKEIEEGRVTYRGLGLGKLSDDFYKLSGEGGKRIKVKGKEYFITDSDYRKIEWDEKNEKWKGRIRLKAPSRRYADGGFIHGAISNEPQRTEMK